MSLLWGEFDGLSFQTSITFPARTSIFRLSHLGSFSHHRTGRRGYGGRGIEEGHGACGGAGRPARAVLLLWTPPTWGSARAVGGRLRLQRHDVSQDTAQLPLCCLLMHVSHPDKAPSPGYHTTVIENGRYARGSGQQTFAHVLLTGFRKFMCTPCTFLS